MNKRILLTLTVFFIIILVSCSKPKDEVLSLVKETVDEITDNTNEALQNEKTYETGKPADTEEREPAVKQGDLLEYGKCVWLVLEVRDTKMLLLSERVVEIRPFNDPKERYTWEDCEVRQYLNGEFYTQSFNESKKENILVTKVTNDDNQWYPIEGGNDTYDKIFLLSLAEVVKYFGDSGILSNRPNNYAAWINDEYNSKRAALDLDDRQAWWWLRSPGRGDSYTACVDAIGEVYVFGAFTGSDNIGIRPAMWVKCDGTK